MRALLFFVFTLCCLSETPPMWPTEFTLQFRPFFQLDYSQTQQRYRLYINTLSPKNWLPTGVSGWVTYDCANGNAHVEYDPLSNHWDQCVMYQVKLPTCNGNFFNNLFTNVTFLGNAVLDPSGLKVRLWNITINEQAWAPLLDLSGYEKYTLYLDDNGSQPIGLSSVSLNPWFFDFSPSVSLIEIPQCTPKQTILLDNK